MNEDRIAKIETIVNMHTEEIKDLRASVKQLSNHISEIKTDTSSLNTKVDDMDKSFKESVKNLKEDIRKSNNQNLWIIGTTLVVVNIVISLVIHFI